MTASSVRFAGGVRLARLLGGLISAQTLAQLLSLIAGFLLLRWLSVEEYAQYTIAFGFIAMLGALIDLGFVGAVMPLIGDRASDTKVFGSYMRAALHLRSRLAAVVLPLSGVAFFFVTSDRGWGIGVQAGLFATVALGLLARAMVDIFALPLLMNHDYRSYYSPQMLTGILRLGAHALLQITRGLTSVSASLVNGLTGLATGGLYRRSSADKSDLPASVDPERTREIRRMVAPVLPGLIFYAFQGQITIVLVSVFGRTESIAEVGALSRLTALFVIFGGITQVLVAPRFPQIPRERLVRRTVQVLTAAAALGGFLTAVAFLMPAPLLFLLGPEYDDLRLEVAWFVVAASLSFGASVTYAINLARRFIWWWSTALVLGLVLATQFVAATAIDLGSTLELQYFAALTGVAGGSAQVVALVYGLRRGPRST